MSMINSNSNPINPPNQNIHALPANKADSIGFNKTDSVENQKTHSVSIEILQHVAPEPSSTLKSSAPKHPEVSQIADKMKLSPKLDELTSKQKEKVVNECIKSYTASVAAFEEIIGNLSAEHPDAKEFAMEMVQRLFSVTEAYKEVLLEDNPDSKTMSSLNRELTVKLGALSEFFGDATGTGSVGSNPMAIKNALNHGELREQLTLIYTPLWGVLPSVLEKPAIVDRVNVKLNEKGAGFQLNTEEINKKREQSTPNSPPVITFFSQAKPLAEFRKAGGRLNNTNPAPDAPKAKDIQDLTLREYRATIDPYITETQFEAMKKGEAQGKEWGEHRVQWVRGKDLFKINENSDFYQQSVQLGKLPVVTGPSGTTDGYLLGVNYLNMKEYEHKAMLALTGWMVRSGDHTLHEIKEAGTWHGIDYTPGPDTFENAYPDDPKFQENIKTAMKNEGHELPGEYLKDDYQVKMAQKLGFI